MFNKRNLLNLRDPSILAGNLPSFQRTDEIESKNYLNVYLRIKGGVGNFDDLYEVTESGSLISKLPEGSYQARNIRPGDLVKKVYNFSKIFGPETEQFQIFNELMKPKLFKFMNGENCSVMTYGVSSSGKTYTIVGTSQEPGVLPRSLEYLFKTLPPLPKEPVIKPLPNGLITRLLEEEIEREIKLKEEIINYNWPNMEKLELINTYRSMQSRLSEEPAAEADDASNLSISVWVSFAEIYNEHIHDLLKPEGKSKENLKLGSSNGYNYIKNLSSVYVSNSLEAFQVLQYGLHHLNYAKTKINDHSSRSHSIFTIKLAQAIDDDEEEFCISQFNFCDLAGAERSKKTMNVGDRLKESNNINTSLLVLGRCIAGVRNAQKSSNLKMIPFRESKLTQLFQRALSGQEDISMVVNMNPCRELFDETQHVLNFSAIAKSVTVELQPKVFIRSSKPLPEPTTMPSKTELATQQKSEERKLQELKNKISEYTELIEIEEADQQMEINGVRNEIMSEYANVFEMGKQDLENEYNALEVSLVQENKRKLKELKKEIMESLRKNGEALSFSSDSSDDDVEEFLAFNSSTLGRKRKAATDLETIMVFSSDEEEDVKFWEEKVESQQKILDEILEERQKIRDEISGIKETNEALARSIEDKKIKIKRLMDIEATFN